MLYQMYKQTNKQTSTHTTNKENTNNIELYRIITQIVFPGHDTTTSDQKIIQYTSPEESDLQTTRIN